MRGAAAASLHQAGRGVSADAPRGTEEGRMASADLKRNIGVPLLVHSWLQKVNIVFLGPFPFALLVFCAGTGGGGRDG